MYAKVKKNIQTQQHKYIHHTMQVGGSSQNSNQIKLSSEKYYESKSNKNSPNEGNGNWEEKIMKWNAYIGNKSDTVIVLI